MIVMISVAVVVIAHYGYVIGDGSKIGSRLGMIVK